ncbi:MAG: glycerol-3-phosphate 1-O-acyltransferase PlsY [Planctomycetes bacterium]|nr:glycerol-3-phosphate 1-O-acyltransferase PlsY [Planctomycetota bacterium]
MTSVTVILALAGGYLIGSIPFGMLAGWCRGVDVQLAGSGNIGATNVGRLLGRPWGFAVFALDFLKGFAPATWAAAVLSAALPEGALNGEVAGVAVDQAVPLAGGVGAVFGHVFPVYLRFRGGKGVATGAGACLAITLWPTVCGLVVWGLVLGLTRYMSLASIGGAVALPVAHALRPGAHWPEDGPVEAVLILLAMVVAIRHRGNVGRIVKRTEPKVGSKREEPPAVSG